LWEPLEMALEDDSEKMAIKELGYEMKTLYVLQ
jgi:hypothetical protein